jgi:tRNA threonylcarbamoyladenosine biosynthesis protein TsaB
MKLLAIDTSGEACSAALLMDDQVEQRLSRQPRRHGDFILGMMEDLLGQAGLKLGELDALAFGRGPGSFTGVRIATAVIQGAAFGADLAVVPVSTLAALAQGHYRVQGCERSLPALDARMGELYWGCYVLDEAGLMRPAAEEQVAAPEDVVLPYGGSWRGVGSGWAACGEALRRRLASALLTYDPAAICEAQDVARLAAADFAAGRFVAAERALPVYLRDRVTAAR